jgi:hypothetical protein
MERDGGESGTRSTRRGVANPARTVLAVALLAACLSGCAATRSPVTGAFTGAAPVTLLLHFRHLQQQHGLDTIPKFQAGSVKDFQDILRDALGEVTNLSAYATFTEGPDDVNLPSRRQEARDLREKHDYTLDVTVLVESSF